MLAIFFNFFVFAHTMLKPSHCNNILIPKFGAPFLKFGHLQKGLDHWLGVLLGYTINEFAKTLPRTKTTQSPARGTSSTSTTSTCGQWQSSKLSKKRSHICRQKSDRTSSNRDSSLFGIRWRKLLPAKDSGAKHLDNKQLCEHCASLSVSRVRDASAAAADVRGEGQVGSVRLRKWRSLSLPVWRRDSNAESSYVPLLLGLISPGESYLES